LTDLFRICRRD